MSAIIGVSLFHACLQMDRQLKKKLGEDAEKYSKNFHKIFSNFRSNDLLPIFKIGQRKGRLKKRLKKKKEKNG